MTRIATAEPEAASETNDRLIIPFARARRTDVQTVGGKGGNLGEMTAAGLPVPPGFIIAIDAYHQFVDANELGPRIAAELARLKPDDSAALDHSAAELRQMILDGTIPESIETAIADAYARLDDHEPRVAVRSSATAEDTADYSFAGMFESFLNVSGRAALADAVRACWASTFGARVLFYRAKHDLPLDMPVAVVVQRMIDAEKSGVMFTTDPATGESNHIVIEAVWGLGEAIVQGAVTPDHHVLNKRTLESLSDSVSRKEFLLEWDEASHSMIRVDLTDDPRAEQPVLTPDELTTLGKLARDAEAHYGAPQDMEFAIEGGTVYLTQSRPITTLGTKKAEAPSDAGGAPRLRGLGASPGRASGPVRVLESPTEAAEMKQGEILVTRMTSPDWVPIMRRAAAIVTDAGGMTSHASIVARELGLPCVVGARNATRVLTTGMIVTVDGSAGTISAGAEAAETPAEPPKPAPTSTAGGLITATRLYVNLGEPSRAADVAARDVDGVGLLRAEFMMLEALEHTHPREFLKRNSGDAFVERMADGLRTFASAFAPRPVVYRTMDFRSNEFRKLEGGDAHEPSEANPMIGYRGCFRYTREPDLFELELRAIAAVREQFDNIHMMIPFVRTAGELAVCLRLVDESPLGSDARLERWIMAEVPSVVWQLERYKQLGITGVSIGSNDLTQLVLGVDRDSELFGSEYDERDPAVLAAIETIIRECRRLGLTCSICGQAPSVHPEYAARLVEWGIDSISVNVDAIDRTRRNIATAERRLVLDRARQPAA